MSDDERAIRDLIAAWMSATQAGDAETVLGLMTDDVVFMVPGREPFGKEAFAAASQSAYMRCGASILRRQFAQPMLLIRFPSGVFPKAQQPGSNRR